MSKLNSNAGKQMLARASAKGYAVIEFAEDEDGELRLMEITDHYRGLEQRVNDEDPKPEHI